METILANSVAKPQRTKWRGRDWLVVSASLIVPGVLNGSRGALFYPEDELPKNAHAWNGMPIVVRHPKDDNGNFVSARQPQVLERFGIGSVFNVSASGKLSSQAWFDVEAVRDFDTRNNTDILTKLNAGLPVELSTGLITDAIPEEGTYNGKAYTHVARNYRPDHLALLPDEPGACSVKDGCGFNVNAFCPTGEGGGLDNSCGTQAGDRASAAKKIREQLRQAKEELRSTYESVRADAVAADERAVSHSKSIVEHSMHVASDPNSSLGKAYAHLEETISAHDDSASPSERFLSFKEIKTAALKALEKNAHTKPGKSADDLTKDDLKQNEDRLTQIVKEAKDGQKALQEHVQHRKEMRAIREGTDLTSNSLDYPNLTEADLAITSKDADKPVRINVNEEDSEAITDSLLQELHGLIGVNVAGQVKSKVTGWFKRLGAGIGAGEVHESAQKGHVILTTKQEELGAQAKAEAEAGNNPPSWVVDETKWDRAKAAADKGEYGPESYYAVVTHIYEKMGGEISVTANQEDQNVTKAQMIENLTANCDCWKGKAATLNKLSDQELQDLLTNVQQETTKRKATDSVLNSFRSGVNIGNGASLVLNSANQLVVKNAEGEECAPDDVECLEMMKTKKVPPPVPEEEAPVKNHRKPTLKEWEDSMPPEAREVWNAAKETERNERVKLVGMLVGNIANSEVRQAKAKKLMQRTTADLREQVELVQAAIAANTQDTVLGNSGHDYTFDYRPTLYASGGADQHFATQLTDNEQQDVLPDPSDSYVQNGLNDPSVNAGEGVVRYFRGAGYQKQDQEVAVS